MRLHRLPILEQVPKLRGQQYKTDPLLFRRIHRIDRAPISLVTDWLGLSPRSLP